MTEETHHQGVRLCPTCHQKWPKGERGEVITKDMIDALWGAFKWCKHKEVHEFKIGDIRDSLSHVQYSNMNKLPAVGFGGLVYRPEVTDPNTGKKKSGKSRGLYGLNMKRCEDFFGGALAIPTLVWVHPITKEQTKERYRFIYDMPKVVDFLNADQEFVALYREPKPKIEEIQAAYSIPSKTIEGVDYTVVISGEKITCTCQSFRFRATCKHIDRIKEERERIDSQNDLFSSQS